MILVSTVIGTHNRAAYLPGAIESALAQNQEGHEIIVVDDSSVDNTAEVAARYPVRCLRVSGGNVSKTRNAGVRAAQGKWITFLDDDDLWLPGRLPLALKLAAARPDAGLIYGRTQPVDDQLKPFGSPFPALPLAEGHPVSAFLHTVIHLNATMVRRDVFEKVGYFSETHPGSEDMDFTVRVARQFVCVAVPQTLAVVRHHDRSGQETRRVCEMFDRRFQDSLVHLRTHLAVRDAYRPNFATRLRIAWKHRGWYAYQFQQQALRAKNPADARFALLCALRASWPHTLKSAAFRTALPGALRQTRRVLA